MLSVCLRIFRRALTASIYLRMDRPDQATAQLKSMQEADEDSTLSQLTAAWIDLYVVRVFRFFEQLIEYLFMPIFIFWVHL